jgi:hypothetical protein
MVITPASPAKIKTARVNLTFRTIVRDRSMNRIIGRLGN